MSARVALLIAGSLVLAMPARSQTDYYNTDAGRPVQIEDAHALERRGFELQVAPVRISRARGGLYTWGVEPELAFGFARRTQVEVGLPLAFVDAGSGRTVSGLSGVNVSVLHTLNAETSLPAMAIAADVLLPAGGLGPKETYASVKGIVTRTLPMFRIHANAQYTFGSARASAAGPSGIGAQAIELSRWLAGIAVDKPLALRSLLLTAEVYARQPLDATERAEWNSGVGVRYQLHPRWAVDGGLGRTLTGDAQAWYLTAGGAYAFGLPWRAR